MSPHTRTSVRPSAPAVAARTAAATVISGARRGHPGLFWFAVSTAVLAVLAAVGLLVDDRELLGAPVWAKPLKFALSFGLYALALAWMLSLVRGGRRTGTVLGWVLVACSAIEIVIIFGQATRGVRSHFNDDSEFDALLFSIMGMTVAVLWLVTLALAVVVLRRAGTDPATAWSIRLGLLVGLLGMLVGVLMGANGSHSVGVPDGGPGLALFGWSTTGGDLRVGHFVGMHALQLLPLLAAVLATMPRRLLTDAARLRLVVLAGAGYLGLVVLLTWQALRGQPVTAPDTATLAALGALLLTVGVGAVLAVRRHPSPQD
jgi:hypothetical protein